MATMIAAIVFASGLSNSCLIVGDDALVPVESASQGQAILQNLRDRDLEQALNVLGNAADQRVSLVSGVNSGIAAAAGGLYRALSQLSEDEQYDLLSKWSLPTAERKTVRVLSSVVPQDSPPKEFARLLGERPRDDSFNVSQIGGVRGLFSTGWMLVQAADQIGRLRQLTGELEELASNDVPNADALLLLAQLADQRGDMDALKAALLQRIPEAVANVADADEAPLNIDPTSVVLAAAALEHEELRAVSEELLHALEEQTHGRAAPGIRPFLRVAHATAVQRHRGESGPDVLYENRLKYWVSTSGTTSDLSAAGEMPAMWLVHEDHILHLAGGQNDVLFCRFPLTGQFDFLCETQIGGAIGTNGGLVSGGLQFQALGQESELTVWDADLAHEIKKPCPFVRQEDRPTFNRLSIRSTAEGAQFLANLHPMWFDGDASANSPWVGLRAFGPHRPLFRNLKITGEPVIPREVMMTSGDELRGWRSRFYGEAQPPFANGTTPDGPIVRTAEASNLGEVQTFDWSISEGIIVAPKREPQSGNHTQSLLQYQRPLLDGEQVTYEFHFQPGEQEVHPALGRLAFLVEPGGIRIRWMTDGDLEWSGLPVDNATLEPLNRRGPRMLPLKEDDWNSLTLALADGSVTLTLNNVLVYERPVDYGGDKTFGLYRGRTQAQVRVRNVVMTGDWPESLPKEFIESPAAVSDDAAANGDDQVRNQMLDDDFIAENICGVRRAAAMLSAEDRYEYLRDWILPTAKHPTYRMTGMFTQTDPSPLAIQLDPLLNGEMRGSELVSPVYDLLNVAEQLNRIPDLRERVAQSSIPPNELQQRARVAILALIDMEFGVIEDANPAFQELQTLVSADVPQGLWDQWPETLVVYRGVHHHKPSAAVGDLLDLLYARRVLTGKPEDVEDWHTQISALMARFHHLEVGGSHVTFDAPESLNDWIPLVRSRARSRGRGQPSAHWHLNAENEVEKWAGHQDDYLLYRAPLRGNFSVEGDINGSGNTQFLAAGNLASASWSDDMVVDGTFRKGSNMEKIEPPFSKLDRWVRYRASFADELCSVFVNGRKVQEVPLPAHPDPWIGIRSWWRNTGKVRDFRITGNPQIPNSVVLSGTKDLSGWLPYFDESIGYTEARWEWINDQVSTGGIRCQRAEGIVGSFHESLLRYYRPLENNSTIEYEFFYEQDQTEAHPALDRLAFVLKPDGVRLHQITDASYDSTDVPPDNLLKVPDNQRGPRPLPLNEADSNHLQMSLADDVVQIELNGQLIFERTVESTNDRTFGLFHFNDQTELRVRNVVMSGDWQTALGDPDSQQLADARVVQLDRERDQLPPGFQFDFAGESVNQEFFALHGVGATSIFSPSQDGLHIRESSSGKWSQVALAARFTLEGDFDIDCRFTDFQTPRTANSIGEPAIHLQVKIPDTVLHEPRMIRMRNPRRGDYLKAQLAITHPDDSHQYIDSIQSDESTSGRLRIARRGETASMLFAQGDSSVFRVIGQEKITTADVPLEGVRVAIVAVKGGSCHVALKDLNLRAERLRYLSPNSKTPQRTLNLVNANGSGQRVLAEPPSGFTHMGSPEWSADGRTIVLDVSTGSTSTSRVFAVNVATGKMTDLGPGCMPSLSPDGKQIVFSSPGIMMMDSDGTNRRSIDTDGWGVQWSPDGKNIAYGKSGNVTLMNVETTERRNLMRGNAATRYNYIYWNLGWSHNSRSIAFKARNAQTGAIEVVLSDVDSPEDLIVLHDGETNVNADFTFSADNQSVLMALHDPEHPGPRLYLCHRDHPGMLTRATFAPDQKSFDCDWSPDGQQIAVNIQPEPQPVDWPPNDASSAVD